MNVRSRSGDGIVTDLENFWGSVEEQANLLAKRSCWDDHEGRFVRTTIERKASSCNGIGDNAEEHADGVERVHVRAEGSGDKEIIDECCLGA